MLVGPMQGGGAQFVLEWYAGSRAYAVLLRRWFLYGPRKIDYIISAGCRFGNRIKSGCINLEKCDVLSSVVLTS